MLNVYTIAESISAAQPGAGYASSLTEAYQFHTDSIDASNAEMAYSLMSEAVAMNETFAVTEEIMAEAAFNNPRALRPLTEASFQTVKDGAKKFFDKIISFVMGIINKIKAVFAKTTGNVNKWLEVMKPRIQATQGNVANWRGASAEMWTFNINYICNGMPDGVGELRNQWGKLVGATKDNTIAGLVADAKKMNKYVNKQTGGTPPKMADGHSKAIDALNAKAEHFKSELKRHMSEFPGVVAKAMGCKANSSLDAIWSECGVKAHDGKTQKVTVTYGGQVDQLLSALEMSTDAIKNLSDEYEKHLKDLKSYRQTIDEAEISISGGEDVPNPVVSAGAAAFSAQQNLATTMTSKYVQAMNRAKDLSLSYMREMCREYMSVLSKFAAMKG
ncbi:MAG: hypothetical protein K2F99_02535 [Muribaculaceae bacterium]|nr:hypothetical protein [Muribaculaceae bacterium]